MSVSYIPVVLLLLVMLSACQSSIQPAVVELNEEEQLGKSLFFDSSLSNPSGQSCASCHSPQHGFAEPDRNLPVSQGAIPKLTGSRNAPSVAYAGFSPAFHFDKDEGLYIGGQFVDGRASTLEAQAVQPMLNPLEMNNRSVSELLDKVRAAGYAEQFHKLYGEGALGEPEQAMSHISKAISAYERSQEVVPFSSKYDLYLAGKLTLTEQEMRGLEVFESEKKGNCAACHPSAVGDDGAAPLFTDFSYDNLGVPKNSDNPFYTMSEKYNPDGNKFIDRGLGPAVKSSKEDGKFKVPSLRNIALTAPYMHNGLFTSLEEVVDFYNSRDVKKIWGAPEVQENVNSEELGDLGLSDSELADLVAFLRTLSDGYRGN